jgi:hypothetical protein
VTADPFGRLLATHHASERRDQGTNHHQAEITLVSTRVGLPGDLEQLQDPSDSGDQKSSSEFPDPSRSDTGAHRDEPDPDGAGQPMIGTLLMLFFGLPSMTRSLYAT